MNNSTSLSTLRKTYLSSTIATQEWTSENFTELSTTNLFIDTVTDELSNNINPKLSTIADSVEEEVAKLDELSGKLSGYATINDISAAIQTLDGNVVGSAGTGKTLTSFSQIDGKVTAEFADIAITKSQVTDFPDIPEVDGTFVHLSGDTLSDDFALKTSDRKNFLSTLAWRGKNNSLAIGYDSQVSSNYSLAVGAKSIAGNSATAIGQTATATDSSTAIGRLAQATGSSATALGNNAQALSSQSIAIGYNASSNGYDGIAIGGGASTENGKNNDAIAIGANATAIGAHSIAMGRYAVAAAQNSIQLGVINNFPLSNNTANTFQVWDKPLLERTGGKIFFDRIPTGTTSATVAVGNHTHNTADLVNNAGFITSAQVDEKIDAARVKTMEYQGSVTTYADLPSSGNKQGDVWNVVSAYNDNPPGTNYAWNGTAWDPLGGSIDTSIFALKSEIPEVSLDADAHSITVNGITADIPSIQTEENALTVNGTSYSIPYVYLDSNSLTVNGNYVSIPNVQLDGNSLTVNSNTASIPNAYIDGSTVYIDGSSVTVPNIQTSYNSLTVDNYTYTIPTQTSQLTNDSGFLTAVGELNTTNETAQTPNSKESFTGTINLHKVSKTGSYNDLLNKPELSDYVSKTTTDAQYLKGDFGVSSVNGSTVFNGAVSDKLRIGCMLGNDAAYEGIGVTDYDTFCGTWMDVSAVHSNYNVPGTATDLTFPPESESGQIATKTYIKNKIMSGLSAMPANLDTFDKALSAIQVLWNTLNSLTSF